MNKLSGHNKPKSPQTMKIRINTTDLKQKGHSFINIFLFYKCCTIVGRVHWALN